MNESIENEIDKYARPLFRIITSEKLHMVRGISFAGGRCCDGLHNSNYNDV